MSFNLNDKCPIFTVFLVLSSFVYFAKGKVSAGQKVADDLEYPFVIYIKNLKTGGFGTGVLLDREKIATAAHVVKRFSVENGELVGGVVNVNKLDTLGLQTRKVRTFVKHPKHKQASEPLNDVCYIIADAPFDINEYVFPAKLGGYNIKSFSKAWDRVVDSDVKCDGLAFIPNGGTKLMSVKMYSLKVEKCKTFATEEWYDAGVRCLIAYRAENVLCSDVSGGPLVCDGKIYGIFSSSSGGYPATPGPEGVVCDGVKAWFMYNSYGNFLPFFDVAEWSGGGCLSTTPSTMGIAFAALVSLHRIFERVLFEN